MAGSRRGLRMLRAMAEAAPIPVRITERYEGNSEILMLYGVGHPERLKWWKAHQGTRICWDLGYWNRQEAMRVAVGHEHPRNMPQATGDRFKASGITLRNDYKPTGHILLAGMGTKSRSMLGFKGQEWEKKTLWRIKRAYPESRIYYKAKRPEEWTGCRVSDQPIERLLKNAALVVCRHSNVAIDACIAGVPVVCEDGAAAELYGSDLAAPRNPSHEERLAFLQRLAWWQWKNSEAAQAWKFLLTVCGSTSVAAGAKFPGTSALTQ